MRKYFRKVRRFLYVLWFEWLKISYKPVQFYYTNTINDNHHKHKSVGVGQSFLFCNRTSELRKVKIEFGLKDNRWYNIDGYPALLLIGSEISNARLKSKQRYLPKSTIISILKRQKTDKAS